MTNPVIIELAERLAAELQADVALATTRMEHVRLTARANAAAHLLQAMTETEEPSDESQVPTLF